MLKAGTISIARWKDGKRAAATVFSSDGMIRSIKSAWTPENPDVAYDGFYALGKRYSIPFTFFLPPRIVDDPTHEAASALTPPAQPAGSGGTWADWQFIHAQGHEIASHTYSHVDLRPDRNDPTVTRSTADPDYELSEAIVSIERGVGERPISINPSYGQPTAELRTLFMKYYPVVRGEYDAESVFTQHKDVTCVADLTDALDAALAEAKWLVVAGHGLRTELGRQEEAAADFASRGKRWDGWKPVEYAVMDGFCKALDGKRDEVFIGAFGDVGRYLQERNNAEIAVISESGDEVVFELTHTLEGDVFDYPLTVRFSPSEAGGEVTVRQGGSEVSTSAQGDELLFDVVPNGGPVTITARR